MPSRLKALELQGYKTFANRTLFEFADTVTAIVGPNGSGKSNITDAVRWVLGEQSYSLLRGRKTEDMIFSGSENRPRAGMASATITFDNSDSWLPIDYSEVAVTRRAYRDGQNEYLINGQKVRLRDVSELLAQSGLAERTYTIIGQGLVDAALSLKADERRRLFEEAAGIGLYRSRREDALRRLDTTRRNLDRVQDIMAELRPRLRSLERQARRAKEYDQVKDDLRVLLREWYGYHWHHTQRELAEAQELARIQEVLLDQTREKQAGFDKNLSRAREHIGQLRVNLNAWHRKLAEVHTLREALSRNLAVAEERDRALQERIRRIQSELVSLSEEIGLNQERLDGGVLEVERFEAELDEARTQAQNAQNALAQRQAERADLEKNVQVLGEELTSLSDLRGQLQARLTERRLQIERDHRALTEASTAVEEAERSYQEAGESLEGVQSNERSADEAYKIAEQEQRTHQGLTSDLDQKNKQAMQERSGLQADLASLKAQLRVLDQAEAALIGYAGGTRVLLQAAKQDQLEGTRGVLSSFLGVPSELERPIAAALGVYLDAVLLEDDPEEALVMLEKEAARGALLPLTFLKSPPKIRVPEDQRGDLLGIAAELIEAPPDLRQVVEYLLGRVFVVRDRQAARQVLKDQDASVRAVTLRGEIFYASGPIQTIGGEGPGSETVLSRTRQRRELGSNIQRVGGRLDALDERVDQLGVELQKSQEEDRHREQILQETRQKWEQAALTTNRTRVAYEQVGQQLRWQREKREQFHADIERSERVVVELTERLEELDNRFQETQERLRGLRAQISAISMDEQQSQVAHWNTLSAVSDRALSDSITRRGEWQNRLDKLNLAKTAFLESLDETNTSCEVLEAEKVQWRQQETEVAEEIKSLQKVIDPAELELGELEHDQGEIRRVEADARQALSSAEHQYAQARIKLAHRQESLETLRARIEDDLGLVAFEYVEEVSGPTPLPFEGMVEQLPSVDEVSPELEETIKRQRAQLRRVGAINPEAQSEYKEVKERYEFMTEQVADLERAEKDVREVISELDALMEREFRKTFEAVASEFRHIFSRLFGGGAARLVLTNPDDLTISGIDIIARLPGRRSQGLSLLSGGERSLTAAALVFALLKVSPTPFCVLDEVDAMLDEVNVGRYREFLRELSQNTQFVVVTHNRNTVQAADIIYGVTMGRDSVSQVLSLKLDEIEQVVE